MSQDDQKKTTETGTADEAARRARRRAFLRGAAAVPPAIVTLSSGSAWAVSGTCFSRLDQNVVAQIRQGNPNQNAILQRLRNANISVTCWNSGNLTDPISN